MTGAPLARLTPVLPLAIAGLLALGGCAGTRDCVSSTGTSNLTPAQVSAGGGHTGALQRWGGTLVSTRNLKDSTELEVMGYPLNNCGEPQVGSNPVGRFIAISPGFLEPVDYRSGRQVTATGLLVGTRDGQVGEAPYRFPLLDRGKVHLWPEVQQTAYGTGGSWPSVTIGIGGGNWGWGGGGWGGGIGVGF